MKCLVVRGNEGSRLEKRSGSTTSRPRRIGDTCLPRRHAAGVGWLRLPLPSFSCAFDHRPCRYCDSVCQLTSVDRFFCTCRSLTGTEESGVHLLDADKGNVIPLEFFPFGTGEEKDLSFICFERQSGCYCNDSINNRDDTTISECYDKFA